jgi:hypothetical protein
MLIGLIGKKQSGKDTFADFFCQLDARFKKDAFANPLKQICQIVYGLDLNYFHDNRLKEEKIEEWNQTPREMMQKIGTDLFRQHFDPDIWIKIASRRFKKCKNLIITDVRFANEAEAILQNGGVLIQIVRDSNLQHDSHISENMELNPEKIYSIIENDDSLEKYHEKIFLLYHQLINNIL